MGPARYMVMGISSSSERLAISVFLCFFPFLFFALLFFLFDLERFFFAFLLDCLAFFVFFFFFLDFDLWQFEEDELDVEDEEVVETVSSELELLSESDVELLDDSELEVLSDSDVDDRRRLRLFLFLFLGPWSDSISGVLLLELSSDSSSNTSFSSSPTWSGISGSSVISVCWTDASPASSTATTTAFPFSCCKCPHTAENNNVNINFQKLITFCKISSFLKKSCS